MNIEVSKLKSLCRFIQEQSGLRHQLTVNSIIAAAIQPLMPVGDYTVPEAESMWLDVHSVTAKSIAKELSNSFMLDQTAVVNFCRQMWMERVDAMREPIVYYYNNIWSIYTSVIQVYRSSFPNVDEATIIEAITLIGDIISKHRLEIKAILITSADPQAAASKLFDNIQDSMIDALKKITPTELGSYNDIIKAATVSLVYSYVSLKFGSPMNQAGADMFLAYQYRLDLPEEGIAAFRKASDLGLFRGILVEVKDK